MKTEILKFKDVKDAKEIIEDDGVVAFPTETVYGLGVRYDSFLAYKKIFEVKNRVDDKALTLMLYDKKDIETYVKIDEKINRIIDEFVPGPLTIVLPKNKTIEVLGSIDTVGIRIPDNLETLSFLRDIEIPMFVTSANVSGEESATTFEQVYEAFNTKIEGIVKGEVVGKQASTVISIIDEKIKLLRDGPIGLSQIEEVYQNG